MVFSIFNFVTAIRIEIILYIKSPFTLLGQGYKAILLDTFIFVYFGRSACMGVGLRDASLNLRISRHQIAEVGISLRQFSQSPK